jgi:hypothetical protein
MTAAVGDGVVIVDDPKLESRLPITVQKLLRGTDFCSGPQAR